MKIIFLQRRSKRGVSQKGGDASVEIFRIAPDGSGALKRVDDVQGTIRAIAEEIGFERDYNLSYRQYVARLIQHINGLENNKNYK